MSGSYQRSPTDSEDPYNQTAEQLLAPTKLKPGAFSPYGSDTTILFRDDFVLGKGKKRTWSEKLFYGVGTTYLVGLTAGGAWGVYEGLRHPDATSPRLRFNSVLNAVTRRGPFLGNTWGVIALMYHIGEISITSARGEEHILNNVAAGAAAGLLFKSTAGIKAAGLAGAIGAGFMAVTTAASDYYQNNFA